MGLTRLAIRRPIVVLMALAAILILGWRGRAEMPEEFDPRVEMPIVNIITVYPGAGPQEVEQRLTRALEDAVATVANVTAVESRSLEAISFVTVRLRLKTDINAAAADVRAQIDSIRHRLPAEIEPPQIAKWDFNARPVMVLGLSGPLEGLRTVVEEQVRPRLGQVPGVGSIAVLGGLQREVRIEADPHLLAAQGLTFLDLLQPLETGSLSVPAGSLFSDDRDISVRVAGDYSSLEEIRNTIIPPPASAMPAFFPDARGPGQREVGTAPAPLRLRDVATVTDTYAERQQITRVNQRESLGIIISRLSNANTVEVAAGVHRELEALRGQLPPEARLAVLQDHSLAVSDALEDIHVALILGALLAVLVVWLFLHGWKDTLIIACSIPTTLIATFLVMWVLGFSMNQMTMLALALSVGILVDDSILVLECIHRHRAMGKSPHQAALDGRAEIGLADAANTFTDVVVFIPVAFMGGIVGQFFFQFGITIAAASLISLYVSFTLTPMLAAHWYRPGEGEGPGHTTRGFSCWFDRRYAGLEEAYRRTLGWALRRRGWVAGAGFGSLALVGLLAWQVLGFDFTPSVDRGQVSVQVELPPGASLAATDRLLARVEEAAAGIPEVDADRMLASVGEIVGGFGALAEVGPQFGQVTLMLIDRQSMLERLARPFGQPGKRRRSDEQVAGELRERLAELQGDARVSVSALRGLTEALAPIQIGLYSNDLNELEAVAAEMERRLDAIPALHNVDTSMRRGKPEIRVALDRERAEERLVTAAEVGALVRTALAGNADLRYRDGDRSYPIRLQVARAGDGGISNSDDLENLVVAHRGSSPVHLGDVADLHLDEGPTKILRSQRTRRAILSADVREGVSLRAAQEAVEGAVRSVATGTVAWRWEGDVDDMAESAQLVSGALILAIALAYMLLAALFNSVLFPLTIMLSVPMALVGGLLGLIYTGTTLNIVSMIGMVMLVGLVAKNAILLVDYTNTLRSRGLHRNAALQEAGPVRLRPILMTTLSTVIALLPVALHIGRASEMRSPMAIVVIGGLLLSTLLTLLVIPVMYTYVDDLGSALQRLWRKPDPHTAGSPTSDGITADEPTPR
jgi:hydrophobic/amphiphilic exporter-1 (mainly G- bacteria), HAE1 family